MKMSPKISIKLGKSALHDSMADSAHKIPQEIKVMVGRQAQSQDLVSLKQVPDIRPAVMAADIARALRVYGAHIAGKFGVAQGQVSLRDHNPPVSGNACRKDTIKKIYPSGNALQQGIG